jgi:(p)ppGpp synthase/HD superfamily hydrolase
MMTSADAKAFARLHHAGQLDETGQPYIEHLERVTFAAERRAQHAMNAGLQVQLDQVTQAAWLHDVVENSSITAAELRTAGFAEPVVAMVELLTRPKGQATYEEAAAKIIESDNLGAILIALSDNEDNAHPDQPLQPASTLPARYAASMARLRKAAEVLGYDDL